MPVPGTVTDYLDCIRKSGLVPEDRLNAELDRQRLERVHHDDLDGFATSLIDAGLLTKFQTKQLKLGRYKRFMVAGKYKLLELIGVGGMGAVYLCEHVFMKRVVAVKVLPLEKLSDPSNLERFYREARAVAALDHPNIVRAHDIDKADSLHFLVMEYVDGASMQEIVARFGQVDYVRAAHYVAQSAVGLHHANELGMVHRDIKPGNLLLDRSGVIKILDMGLARFFNDKNDNLTAKYDDKCVLGTADYLAPEQALSNVVDIRADIYALGGTFHFMLTGQSPVPEGTIAQKLVFHQTENPKPVTEFRDDVPPELLAVLERMMKKDPNERYQTPLEVAEALAPWTSEAISPPPDHEMPDLCPAVLTLMGHADRIRASVMANRAVATATGYRGLGGNSSSKYPTRGGPQTPNGQNVRLDEPLGQGQVPTARNTHTTPIASPARLGKESVELIGAGSKNELIRDSSPKLGTPGHRPQRHPDRPLVLIFLALALVSVLSALAVKWFF
ncbi:MAG: serine/threonine protein kinase [Gemmataceae bacterium]|nr:serine/threonine protein kinase [Planctomycetia bacterium]MBX3399961.1 serine/threonine protein kinase [Gemmataceae bacterium]